MGNSERKLAVIKRIDAIDEIPDADSIECITIGGWKVVAQKGIYAVNDLAVYLEIDSWVPHTIAPFLTKAGQYPKVFEGVEGQRLKTIKLRGQVSQGLLLPIRKQTIAINATTFEPIEFAYYLTIPFSGDGFPPTVEIEVDEGCDVTEVLGILKWEKPIPAQLAGRVRGSFPWYIPKTDQERIQNYTREFYSARNADAEFEVTEKIDGSSMTTYVNHEGVFGVSSRNNDLIDTPENAYWATAHAESVEEKIRQVLESGMIEGCTALAVQGELCGPGVQGNIYKLDKLYFAVYDIYDITRGGYIEPALRRAVCSRFGFNHVPVIYTNFRIADVPDVQTLLAQADGPSMYRKETKREGLVFKQTDRDFSFKAISNAFLLKQGD